jgi:LEA14-like dessication related protein
MTDSDKMNDAIIKLAEKTANNFYAELKNLPKELQINYIAIRVIQAVLGETLCQLASSREELDLFLSVQHEEIKEIAKEIINGNPSYKEKFSKDKRKLN